MCLEINILRICWILSKERKEIKKREKKTLVYFTVQALTSLTLLTGCLLAKREVSSIIVIIRLCTKIGIWPTHRWLIRVFNSTNIHSLTALTLITWQKVLPIMILSNIREIRIIEITVLIAMVIITLIAPLSELSRKKRFKSIITLSSINNNAWIIIATNSSIRCFLMFITIYSASLILLLKATNKIKKGVKTVRREFWAVAILVGNTIGIPPIAMFWAKVKIIKNIIRINKEIVVLILLASAALIMYNYLNSTLTEIIKHRKKAQIKAKKNHRKSLWWTALLRIIRILLIAS